MSATTTEPVTERGVNGAEILMPMASANVSKPQNGGLGGRMSTRTRVRLPFTLRSVNPDTLIARVRSAVTRVRSAVIGAVGRWWLLAARPPSLRVWLRLLKPDPVRVPGESKTLRNLWVASDHTDGAALMALSTALLLAAGALRWVACHPVRRWTFYLLNSALVTWLALG